jgi:hypothetical protein
VDKVPAYIRFRQHGAVMLGFAHGHKGKPAKLPGMMADYAAEIWGNTKFRYIHCYHTHHDELETIGGVKVEQHEVLAPPDEYAYSSGFISGRSQKSITYSPKTGQSGRGYVNL